MEFVKPYKEEHVHFYSPVGSHVIDTYSLVVDKNTGAQELKKTGKTNIYDYIQKSLQETLIYNVLERYNNGDVTALDKVTGFYGDVLNMPKTLAEAQQVMINAEKLFKSLPLETRAKYNNDVSQFLTSVEKEAKAAEAKRLQDELLASQQAQINELENQNNDVGGAE